MTDRILALKTVSADRTAHNGFVWPIDAGAVVEAPDWDPTPECGGGLHGLPFGEGEGQLLNWTPGAIWIAFWCDEVDTVAFDGKIKTRRAEIACAGERRTVTDFVISHGGQSRAVAGANVSAGRWGTATAGDEGTATAGYRGTATAGYWGTATAGYWGTATAGDRGTATAGYEGTATAGDGGTATVGDRGTIVIRWYDGSRCRLTTLYVGEDGIEPNVAYHLDDKGRPVRVKP